MLHMQYVFMTRHHLTYFFVRHDDCTRTFLLMSSGDFFQRNFFSDGTHVFHVVTRPVVESPSLKKVLKSNKVLRVDRQNEKLSQG